MERRAFLTALFAGIGASFAASQAQALTGLAPKAAAGSNPAFAPEPGIATPEDLENAKVEKTWAGGYWRHRRRRSRRAARRYYRHY
jgi:hypothetical protein